MGGKSAKTPPPPDYNAIAQQQASASQKNVDQQTLANRANQSNPYGSMTWNKDPTTGQWTQNVTLTDSSQRALDAQQQMAAGRSELAAGMMGQVAGQLSQPINTSNYMGWGGAPQAGNLQAITNPYGFSPQQQNIDTSRLDSSGAYRQRAEDAIYGSATSRLDPQWAQRSADKKAELANAGITSGSAAYTKAMDDFNRQRTDAYNQAQMSAVTGGGAEAQRNFSMDQGAAAQQLAAQQAAFGQSLQTGQFGLGAEQQAFGQNLAAGNQNFNQQLAQSQYQNATRGQQLAEDQALRMQGINEMNALTGGQQVQMPQFGNYSQAGMAETPDLMGAAKQGYQGQVDQYNANAAKKAQTMQTVGSVAATAAMMF